MDDVFSRSVDSLNIAEVHLLKFWLLTILTLVHPCALATHRTPQSTGVCSFITYMMYLFCIISRLL